MKSLKKKFEESPLIWLVSVVIVVSSFIFTIQKYFYDENIRLKKEKFNIEIEKYKSNIGDLERRLISIKTGIDKKVFLDISKLTILKHEIPILSKKYKSFSNGEFYVIPDKLKNMPASQIDVSEMLYGKKATRTMINRSKLKDVFSEKNGIIWKGNGSIKIKLPSYSSMFHLFEKHNLKTNIEMTPFIYTVPITESYINKLSIGGISAQFEKFELNLEDESYPNKNINSFIKKLSRFSRDDIAGYLLIDLLSAQLKFSLITGGKLKVISTQKKGNVLYVQTHTVYEKTSINEKHDLILDQSFYYIGTTKGGMLVKTAVPSFDFNSDAYSWVKKWLISLKVIAD